MCGIGLIFSGVTVDLSVLFPDYTRISPQVSFQPLFTEDDIKSVLQRRGPDSVGTKSIYLASEIVSDELENYSVRCFSKDERPRDGFCGQLQFIGATLQLRGVNPVIQPLNDAFENVLVYNGEIFGGIHVGDGISDTDVLMHLLGHCCSCISHENRRSCCAGKGKKSVPEVLSTIKGPWALIYWQDSSKTLWFGRDGFGRRSLLVHWPTSHDPRLLLSSVSPHSSNPNCEFDGETGTEEPNFWEELPCGAYSIIMSGLDLDGCLTGEVKKHMWTNHELNELLAWERSCIHPKPEDLLVLDENVQTSQYDILSSCSADLGCYLVTTHE